METESVDDQSFSAYFNGSRKDFLEWDDYFMAIAKLSAYRSKDPVTQVGAVIVNEENRIVGIGYNGFPRACRDDVFPWYKQRKMADDDALWITKDEDNSRISVTDPVHDKKFFVVHAEANAILNKNSSSLKNTRLYTTLYPCNECAKLILQSGIKKIFYMYHTHSQKAEYRASKYMFAAANIECVQYKAKSTKVVIDLDNKESGEREVTNMVKEAQSKMENININEDECHKLQISKS